MEVREYMGWGRDGERNREERQARGGCWTQAPKVIKCQVLQNSVDVTECDCVVICEPSACTLNSLRTHDFPTSCIRLTLT